MADLHKALTEACDDADLDGHVWIHVSDLRDLLADHPPTAPVVDREALATALHKMRAIEPRHPRDLSQPCRYCINMADRLIADGILQDADTVKAEALEEAALERWRRQSEWLELAANPDLDGGEGS